MYRKFRATRRFLQSSFLMLLLVMTSGCYLRPNLGSPGTIYDQRSRAVLSDPFPNNELGPEVVGGRPRGFDLPLSQPTNIQASPYSNLNKSNRNPLSRLRSPRYAPAPIQSPGFQVPNQAFPPQTQVPNYIPSAPQAYSPGF